jgi:hypothetical protein
LGAPDNAETTQTSLKGMASSFHRNANWLLSDDHTGFVGAVPVKLGRVVILSIVNCSARTSPNCRLAINSAAAETNIRLKLISRIILSIY